VEEIRKFLGLDGLGYLSVEGMVAATGLPESNFCLACFDGRYPVQPDLAFNKNCLEG
jgi:amidophosphoribosyltransferase